VLQNGLLGANAGIPQTDIAALSLLAGDIAEVRFGWLWEGGAIPATSKQAAATGSSTIAHLQNPLGPGSATLMAKVRLPTKQPKKIGPNAMTIPIDQQDTPSPKKPTPRANTTQDKPNRIPNSLMDLVDEPLEHSRPGLGGSPSKRICSDPVRNLTDKLQSTEMVTLTHPQPNHPHCPAHRPPTPCILALPAQTLDCRLTPNRTPTNQASRLLN
jgi:hypothetical protein